MSPVRLSLALVLCLASAAVCDPALPLRVRGWSNAAGNVPAACDGVFAVEGAAASTRDAIVLHGAEAALVLELPAAATCAAFSVQADAGDEYVLEVSTDRTVWRAVGTVARSSAGPGLRTRDMVFPAPVELRYVRVRPTTDGRHALSELQAYARLPLPPRRTEAPTPVRAPAALDVVEPAVAVALVLLALVAGARLFAPRGEPPGRALSAVALASIVVLVAYGFAAQPRDDFLQHHRYVVYIAVLALALILSAFSGAGSLLLALTVLAVLGHYHFGKFHGDGYIHYHEFAHYYVGSKYFEELGYDGLYRAYVAADAEGARSLAPGDPVRDLESRALVTVQTEQEKSALVRARFSDARWTEFRADASFFRAALGVKKWKALLLDHGYNPAPPWSLVGRALVGLAGTAGGGVKRAVWLLALLDPLLVALMIALIALTFDRETAAYALIFWAANPFVLFDYTGGAFAREDWLFSIVLCACLLRRGRPAAAGAALAYAAATRVFLGALALLAPFTRDPERKPFLGGFAVALAAFLAASAAADGVSPWATFFANASAHNEGSYANHLSLRAVLIHEPRHLTAAYGGDARAWSERKRERFNEVRIVFALLALAITALLVVQARDAQLLDAVALAGFLPFVCFHPANYYANYLLPAMLVAGARRQVPLAAALAGTCGFLFIDDYEVYNVFLSAVILAWLAWTLAGRRC